ncbi:uncharacterized protein [Argopecten irradians]|uniref:uncharacterized protein n=1 Tax=Argopecten irradians TaxID=31199 RepID=UPI00371A8B03
MTSLIPENIKILLKQKQEQHKPLQEQSQQHQPQQHPQQQPFQQQQSQQHQPQQHHQQQILKAGLLDGKSYFTHISNSRIEHEVANVFLFSIPQTLVGVCGGHHCQFSEKCVELTSQNSACVSHGLMLTPGMYGDLLSNTRLYHPGNDTNITMYECTTLTDPQAKELFPVARVVNGIYTQASVSCSSVDCYDPSLPYEGSVTVTVSGILCQRWDSSVPHEAIHYQGRGDLKNFCRLSEDNDGIRHWCYTTDPYSRWEFCPIIDC